MEDKYKNIEVLTLDEPNLNGRTYPTHVVERAISTLPVATFGLTGTLGFVADSNIPMDKIAFSARNLRITEGKLLCDIKTWGPQAGVLESCWDFVAFRTAGHANIDSNGVVSNYQLLYIAAVNKDTAA